MTIGKSLTAAVLTSALMAFTGCVINPNSSGVSSNGSGSSGSGGSSSVTIYSTNIVHYNTSWTSPYIHFNNGSVWTTAPGLPMTSEGNNWWVYTIQSIPGSQVQFVFNNGAGTWDNNSGQNYKTTNYEVWVVPGNLFTNNPTLTSNIITVHYTNPAFNSPILTIGIFGQAGIDVQSSSNDIFGLIFITTNPGGYSYYLKFKQGSTNEPLGIDRNTGAIISNSEFWIIGESKAIFASNPSNLTSGPSVPAYTNRLGAEIDGSSVNFTLFSPRSKSVTLYLSGASIPMKLTPDGKFWWVRTNASSSDYYYYVLDGNNNTSDPYARGIYSWNGSAGVENCRIVDTNFSWQDPGFITPTVRDAVIYELHIEDFTSSASSGISANDRGKFLGIADKMDYFTNLGINCVELMPVSQFQGGGSGYNWGYMTRLYYAPSERYTYANSATELKTLVNEAHKRGVAILLDMVYNHAENNPNYLWKIDSDYYFNAWGLSVSGIGYNNLNSTREMAVRLIQDNMKYFMQEFHIDGFRLDLTGHNDNSTQPAIDHGTLERIATNLRAINSNAMLIAENWGANDYDIPSWSKWEGGFKSDMPGILNSGYDNVAKYVWANRDSGRFTNGPWASVIYMDSHDENSPYQYLSTDKFNRARLGAAILLTSMAVPMLWSGEEIGRIYSNTTVPQPIDWTLLSTNTNLFAYYQGLISLRNSHKAFRQMNYPTDGVNFRWNITPGNWGLSYGGSVINSASGAIGFGLNWDGSVSDNRFVIIFNYSTSSKNFNNLAFPADGSWALVADENGINLSGFSNITVSGGVASISVPAKTAFIYMY